MGTHRLRAYLRLAPSAAQPTYGRLQGSVRPNLARTINAGRVNEEAAGHYLDAGNIYHLDLPFLDNEDEARRTYDAVLAEVGKAGALRPADMEASSWLNLHECFQEEGQPCLAPFLRWAQPSPPSPPDEG